MGPSFNMCELLGYRYQSLIALALWPEHTVCHSGSCNLPVTLHDILAE